MKARKPKDWAKAAEFWTLFANDLHQDMNPVRALYKAMVLNHEKKDSKYSRDAKCSLVARAFKSWAGSGEDYSNVETLPSPQIESTFLRIWSMNINHAVGYVLSKRLL